MDKYDNCICHGILANNDFGITKVTELQSLQTGFFVQSDYSLIEKFIMQKEFETVRTQLESYKVQNFGEYLNVMLFRDQNNKQYVVTVYDSDELWQDPQVIKIYSL